MIVYPYSFLKPLTPTPTPTTTPTPTPTPTITPTPTPTPSPTPTLQNTYIGNTTQLGNNTTVTFNSVDIGGPGLIVVTVNSKGGLAINSATIGGISATIYYVRNSNDNSIAGIIQARIAAGTTANIQLVFASTTNAVNIGVYRITNNISDLRITDNEISWNTPMASTRSMSLPLSGTFSSANTKTIITTVTETGLTGPSGQDITFTSSPSTTRNYYQQAANTPTPYYVAAAGITTLNPGTTSFTITANFSGSSNRGAMIGLIWN